jgi:hypothetical protein
VLTLRTELLVPRTNCRVGNEAEACTFEPMYKARASVPDTSQHFQVGAQTNPTFPVPHYRIMCVSGDCSSAKLHPVWSIQHDWREFFMSLEAARTRQSCVKRAAGRKNHERDYILYHTRVASHVQGLSEIRSTI